MSLYVVEALTYFGICMPAVGLVLMYEVVQVHIVQVYVVQVHVVQVHVVFVLHHTSKL